MKRVAIWLTCLLAAFPGPEAEANKRVLYLGDSHSIGAFGRELDTQMRRAGLEVYTVVSGGATPYYWLSDHGPISCSIGHWVKTPTGETRRKYIRAVPKIETLLKKYNPDVTIIQTGTNLYATLRSKRRPKPANVRILSSLIEDMCRVTTSGGRQCYWITPPDAHPRRYPSSLQNEMVSIMTGVAGKYGRVFDSRKVTRFTDPYPKTDGIHYGPTEAREWANLVAADITNRYVGPRTKPRVPMAGLFARRSSGDTAPPKARAFEKPARSKQASLVARLADPPTDRAAPAPLPQTNEPVVVTLRLRKKSTVGHLKNIVYENALGVYEYDVVKVRRGTYPYRQIRIAHMVVMNRKPTRVSDYRIGRTLSLEVVPLARYPRLQTIQIVDNLPARYDLPLYVAKF